MIQSGSSPARRLREAVQRPGPVLAAGAHNPLSALLVQEAGFDAVWASGFEISASQAVPDANILSAAENLAIAAAMARCIQIPVIADCDNGFGNAVNVQRTVRDYEAAGVAAICIEDNVFPKRCAFYDSSWRELVSPEEHAGKVRAAKAAQRDPDFMVLARTEALIAGRTLEEGLARGRAYADAGADAVLIHSKVKTFDEALGVAMAWDRDVPLVVVPTTFGHISAEVCSQAGFKIVIFANHAVRSAIAAMQHTLHTLRRTGTIADVEPDIVPLKEVFRLVGVEQMDAVEREFLPAFASAQAGLEMLSPQGEVVASVPTGVALRAGQEGA